MNSLFRNEKCPVKRGPIWQQAPMARSRCLVRRPAVGFMAAGVALTLLLVSLIVLANGVVNLRLEIDDLQKEKTYLEARYANGLSHWATISSRDVVESRAETELGLRTPDGPGPIIVMLDATTERQATAWQRVMGTFGGGGDHIPTVSAQDRWP